MMLCEILGVNQKGYCGATEGKREKMYGRMLTHTHIYTHIHTAAAGKTFKLRQF